MTPFDKLIKNIKHRKWRVTLSNEIRDADNNCPLDALALVRGHCGHYGYAMGCSGTYSAIGGTDRQAWIIMSAADNRVDDPFTDNGAFSKLKRSEVKAMRDRLIGALVPKPEPII